MKEITSNEASSHFGLELQHFGLCNWWSVYTKTMYGFENNNYMDLDIACKIAHQGQNSVSDPGKMYNTPGQLPSQI